MGGIVGSIFGASGQKKAIEKQTQAITDANNKNIALAQDTRNQNVALFQPQMGYGDAADRIIAGLLGTGGSAQASTDAFNTFRNSTGYQTNLQEGLNAVTANNAARGTFQSGATAKALQDRGVQLNSQYLQQYLQNLTGQSNTGTAAKGAIAGANVSLLNNQTIANNNIADALGKKYINKANVNNALFQNIGNALTSSFTGGF